MLIVTGPVHLMKGSIASSSQEKRNAKKRSFEQIMSATAAKILKMEQERENEDDNEVMLLLVLTWVRNGAHFVERACFIQRCGSCHIPSTSLIL